LVFVAVGALHGSAAGTVPAALAPQQGSPTASEPTLTAGAPATVAPTADTTPAPTTDTTPAPTPDTTPDTTPAPTDAAGADATAQPDGPQTCSVVGEPLVVSEGPDGVWAWGTIQNVGADPVLLSALQASWSGPGRLAETLLSGVGGQERLFAGSASSPATVALRSPASGGEALLDAGATARLGLRYEGATAAALVVGPTVLHLRQGCALALHRPVAGRCALETTDVRPSGNDPRRIVLSVRNRSAVPLDVRALDVYWPHAQNGRLAAIVLGGETRHAVEGADTSPAVLVLERVVGRPVSLAPGASLALWLEFERPAAVRPYVVTVIGADGCPSSSTTWLDAPGCGMRAGDFQTRGLRARLRLSNLLPAPRTPASLELFWPSGVNGALIMVTLDGQPLWTGKVDAPPAVLRLTHAPAIAPNESATLEFSFAPAEGHPDPDGPGTDTISGQDYTAVIGLHGGCRLVYSTLRGPAAGCNVSAGALTVREDRPEVEVSLTNIGGDARLRRLVASWPSRNGELRQVSLGVETVFSGRQAPASEPFAMLPPAGTAVLRSQSTLPLRLRFEQRASRSGYALSLSFVDADGTACTDMVITPAKSQASCGLAIDGLSQGAERVVDALVRNAGEDEVELSFVNVEWPTENGRNRLLRVLLLDRDMEYSLWTGDHRRSPARIPLDGERAAVINAGETVRLRLLFDHLGNVPDPAAAIKLTVGTAEGCQAFHPSDNRDTRPVRESFGGLILGLPADGVWGWWTIEAQRGALRDVRRVLVKSTTRLDPPTIRPAVGDLIRVEAVAFDDGWHAESIRVHGFDQRIQLLGRVVDIDRTQPAGVRPAWIQLHSYAHRVWIVADTYVDGRLDLGAQVSVLGRVDTAGSVTALTIGIETPPADELVAVRGVVQSARRAPELGDAFQMWTLDKYFVRLDTRNPATRLEDPRGRLARPGERFEVHGRLSGNVIAADAVMAVTERRSARVEGIVVSLPPGGPSGPWSVRQSSGQVTSFTVESPAVVDMRSAPAVLGVHARALLEDTGLGQWTALHVQTDWPDG